MNAFKNVLSAVEERRLIALQQWYGAFENSLLRKDCPDAWHDELLRQADELDRLGIVGWQEWRDLRIEADQAYLRAIAGSEYHACGASR